MIAGALAASLLPGCAWATASPADLDRMARDAAGEARSSAEKVRAVVQWTHDNFEWTGTDYVSRSVEEIVERRGGNCREQAMVVQDFLGRLGIACRMTREVNVQPASESRQRSAAALIAQRGARASVFGRRHNDHVWIEYRDHEAQEWVPSDPTINVVGTEAWVQARLGFGARPVHDIVPYADMLFPITVLAVEPNGGFTSRSRHYLVDAFSRYVPGAAASPAWSDWVRLIEMADARLTSAFRGERDFHRDAGVIDGLIAAYERMKRGSHA